MNGCGCKFCLFLPLMAAVLPCLGGCANGGSTGHSIYDRLQSENPADRIQATLEAADRHDRKALPYLVENLASSEADVRFYSYLALQKITGFTMGYEYYADREHRDQDVQRWRQWLKTGQAASGPSSASQGP